MTKARYDTLRIPKAVKRTSTPRGRSVGTESAFALNPGSEYSQNELEFLQAIDAYKRENERPFPSWTEILEIAFALGYRKVAEKSAMPRHPRAKRKKSE
jgi:hypothetical protein